MNAGARPARRQQILEVLAHELEARPGLRITTAALARAAGVSEAALYRHFASKTKMFEALLDFAETSVFGLVNRIIEHETAPRPRCEKIIQVVLVFAEKNPGITRILLGENARLHARVTQFFDRLETQFRQILREANLAGPRPVSHIEAAASQMLAYTEGKLCGFARSAFKKKPTEHWAEQWPALAQGLFL